MFCILVAKTSVKNLLSAMNYLFKKPYNNILFFSLLVYLITAYSSIGYYHIDEHFQILEFSIYKLGSLPAEKLPWEFQEQMRPTIQPIIALVMIKILNAFSVFNPFLYALFLRLISAVAAWFVLYKLSFLLINNFSFEISKKIFLFLSLLLGFAPFINVRFSSENYSAITFLSALYLIIKYRYIIAEKIQYKLIFTGLLLGFSFFFRFQIAFAIIGLGIWLLIINKTKWQNLTIIVLSGACAILICVLADSWFYGKFVFTPYNYFFANIVNHKAADFGVQPWWYYFSVFIHEVSLPFGILLLLLFFIGLIKRPKDPIVWCLIPFLIAHFYIGHKEPRFLFPILFLFTYLTVFGIEYLVMISKAQKYWRLIFILIVACNLPPLLYNMFSPADNGLYFYKYLYEKSPKSELVYISRESNTFNKWSLETNFYNSPNIKSIELKNDTDFTNYLNKCESDTLYVLEKEFISQRKYPGYTNKCIEMLYPNWVLKFNFNDWQSRTSISNIQELIKEKI